MRIEKVRLDKYEGPDKEFVTIGKIYEAFPNVDEDDGEYAIYDDAEDQHVICPDWCTVIQDEFGVRDTEQQPQEWSGEGLPPVGQKCLAVCSDGEYHEVKIVYVNRGQFVAVFEDPTSPGLKYYWQTADRFKPIKSEKDKEIEELKTDINVIMSTLGPWSKDLAETLYNQGYRKTK